MEHGRDLFQKYIFINNLFNSFNSTSPTTSPTISNSSSPTPTPPIPNTGSPVGNQGLSAAGCILHPNTKSITGIPCVAAASS